MTLYFFGQIFAIDYIYENFAEWNSWLNLYQRVSRKSISRFGINSEKIHAAKYGSPYVRFYKDFIFTSGSVWVSFSFCSIASKVFSNVVNFSFKNANCFVNNSSSSWHWWTCWIKDEFSDSKSNTCKAKQRFKFEMKVNNCEVILALVK